MATNLFFFVHGHLRRGPAQRYRRAQASASCPRCRACAGACRGVERRGSDRAFASEHREDAARVYGQRSERSARLLDQLELELEELEAAASEDELAAEQAAMAAVTTVGSFRRKKPSCKPFPEHLPRERIVVPGPTACTCCGSRRLAKLGEDVTETLEVVPRQWKVLQYLREKFTCRACEKISQAPAPFHVLPRGFAAPSLLAMVLFESTGNTSRSTGNRNATGGKASTSACRRSPITSAAVPHCCARSTT